MEKTPYIQETNAFWRAISIHSFAFATDILNLCARLILTWLNEAKYEQTPDG
jgi:hypothetical protein